MIHIRYTRRQRLFMFVKREGIFISFIALLLLANVVSMVYNTAYKEVEQGTALNDKIFWHQIETQPGLKYTFVKEAVCATDSECLLYCPKDDKECDGGPQD